MLESLSSGSGWGVMTIIGPILIGAALAYGLYRASSRRKLSAAEDRVRDDATERLYKRDRE